MNSEYSNKILDLVTEDYFNLYEVYWFVKSNWNYPEEKALNVSINSLRALYKDGYVSFFKRKGYNGKIEKLSSSKVDTILSSQENWKVPKGDVPQIVVTATSEGEKKYYDSN